MSLADIMSGAHLDLYAQVALLLFIFAFAIVVWRVFSRKRKATYDRAARMPLDDENPQTPRQRGE